MILRDVMVPGKELKCEKCQKIWICLSPDLPEFCTNRDCRSREWNGKKKRRKPTDERIQIPKPSRVRSQDEEQF